MHDSIRHYSAEFDFPRRTAPPRLRYLIAATPRSGSTYLSLRLWQTGCLGAPLEYANFGIVETTGIGARLGGGDFAAFWHAVRHYRTSPNGVFGCKLLRRQFVLVSRAHPALLDDFAADHVIYLTRHNRAAQAVSYSRAIRSRQWYGRLDLRDDTRYDAVHIGECERMLELQMTFWERVFALTGARVFRLDYETFCAAPDAAVARIAAFMGVPLDAGPLPIPLLEPQRDARSAEWENAYRREARA